MLAVTRLLMPHSARQLSHVAVVRVGWSRASARQPDRHALPAPGSRPRGLSVPVHADLRSSVATQAPPSPNRDPNRHRRAFSPVAAAEISPSAAAEGTTSARHHDSLLKPRHDRGLPAVATTEESSRCGHNGHLPFAMAATGLLGRSRENPLCPLQGGPAGGRDRRCLLTGPQQVSPFGAEEKGLLD